MTNIATHWNDPTTCPFCGDGIGNPGAGFLDHVDEHPECESGFDNWRANIASDLGGTWMG